MRCANARLLLPIFAFIATTVAHAQSDCFVGSFGLPLGTATITNRYTSIQFGLKQSTTRDGDRLLVASGTYGESLEFPGKNLVVTHDGVGAMPLIQ